MEDYRGYLVKVIGRKSFRCIGQDFYSGVLYLKLPDKLAHLDCGKCTEPTFQVEARLCERIEKDDEASTVLETVLAYEGEESE
ncbi:hypothetical protein NQ117_05570 [Paenibacillus sp. SC116]|uniref:hypothetical protein n=1 Tax=Paenibacillus sp. SC116 TaxID=2968986 RepID=UPI00215AFE7F|nr:hypothetical protein [Paenibacillus sp. SC116]MCR8843142.1 hypothetical protein [Paenibacillus sp. SC116]